MERRRAVMDDLGGGYAGHGCLMGSRAVAVTSVSDGLRLATPRLHAVLFHLYIILDASHEFS